jgi:hypothetical protein
MSNDAGRPRPNVAQIAEHRAAIEQTKGMLM